jgi:hypothetical protein
MQARNVDVEVLRNHAGLVQHKAVTATQQACCAGFHT